MTLSIDPKRTAILAIDFENDIVDSTPGVEPVIENASHMLDGGRQCHIPILFIKVCFDTEYRDAPPKSPLFQMVKQKGILRGGTRGTEIHSRLHPRPDEPVLAKTCINPFLTTNLQQRLNSLGVDTLIIMGLWTNYAVESTVRHASDMGYGVIVLRDACASNAPENHEFTINNILPTLAVVSSVGDVLQALGVAAKPIRKNTIFDELQLDSKGATVQRVCVKAGARVDQHSHRQTTEVYCVVRGNARLIIGEREYAATPGNVYIAKPGERHSLEAIGDEDVEMIMFTTNQEASDVYAA